MGNSASQEDTDGKSQSQSQSHHRLHHNHNHQKNTNTTTNTSTEFPKIPPQGFDQRIPIGGVSAQTTTSVTKESATCSPPGGSNNSSYHHERGPSFHHEEFANDAGQGGKKPDGTTTTTHTQAPVEEDAAMHSTAAGVSNQNNPTNQTQTSSDLNSNQQSQEKIQQQDPNQNIDSGTGINPGTSDSNPSERPTFTRRKSTLLLDEPAEMDEEEMELSKLKLTDELKPLSRAGSGEEIVLSHQDEFDGSLFSTIIEWKQGGSKVYVTGTFTGWRKMIRLSKVSEEQLKHQKSQVDASVDNQQPPSSIQPAVSKDIFSVILKLPKGTHRLRFVVDNELRCSDFLPSATDSMGNLVNYIEVGVDDHTLPALTATTTNITNVDEEGDGEYEKFNEDDELVKEPVLQYGNEIPNVFTDPEVMDRFVSSDFVTPPQLPPHLEGVILNSNSTEKDNNSILPIPNHVVLNHLATTSIKHNVLAVASISRYSRKYVTQILYAPL